MTRVDYSGAAAAYRRSRQPAVAVLERWGDVVRQRAGDRACVLDLGAGPGLFLDPLREWLSADVVVAVEPSAAMRAEAVADHPYVAAVAESLPFASRSFDAVWISAAVHQFDDRVRAAGEVRRVVRPDGAVLVRGFFADVPVTGAFGRFPGIDRAARTFPSSVDVVDGFAPAGLRHDGSDDVVEPWRVPIDDWRARVAAVRASDSLLRHLTDDEIEAGVAANERAAQDGYVDSAVTLRLLSFGAAQAR